MERRQFVLAMSTMALGGGATRAQSPRKPLRIGFIASVGATADTQGPEPSFPPARALVEGLRDLGYRYGSDYVIEGRGGGGRPDRFPALARELVAANVDVIVAAGPTIDAVRGATRRIPIVMVGGAFDPVENKVVSTLASPGGNVTGLSFQHVDLVGKRLELLKEAVPGSAPIGALWEETSVGAWRLTESAATARSVTLLPVKVNDRAALERACANVRNAGARSLIVVGGSMMFENVTDVIRSVTAQRLPAMYPLRIYPDRGGLMSYAADIVDLYRRAATFVDRIAKGSLPATMPIEQPTQVDLVVNLGAAKAIGLTMRASILARAAHVITQ